MSQKHKELEGREKILRGELTVAIALHDAANLRRAEVKTKVDRGARLLEAEQAELEKLETSARDFEARCVRGSAFEILAA